MNRLVVVSLTALSTAAALAGCATDEVSPPEPCRSPQGMQFQGSQLQGTQIQGTQIQGTQIQGSQIQGIQLQGTQIQGTQIQGQQLQGTLLEGSALLGAALGSELVGVTTSGDTVPLFISEIVEKNGLVYTQIVTERGENICGSGHTGMFVPGIWDESGAQHDSLTVGDHELVVSYACTRGVLAKCVEWGYEPWEHGSEVHQACTRLARADYCGDGTSYTEDGTLVDVYDGLGIIAREGGMDFEAGWSADGAVCVNHPRYLDEVVDGGVVLPHCWSELPRCSTSEEAALQGATLFNDSRQQERLWCEAPSFD